MNKAMKCLYEGCELGCRSKQQHDARYARMTMFKRESARKPEQKKPSPKIDWERLAVLNQFRSEIY